MIPASDRISDVADSRDNNFNLIRMLAASGVLVSHAWPLSLGPETLEPLETLLKGDNLGRLCVFVFFAISGFFITRSFVERRSLSGFLSARVLRLFPALAVMLALTVLAGGLWLTSRPGEFREVAWAYYWKELVLFARPPGLPLFETNPGTAAVNGSLWTLRFEVLCYGGVLLAGLAGVFRSKAVTLILLGLFLLSYGIGPQLTADYYVRYLLYLGLPFVYGAALYVVRDHVPRRGRDAWRLGGALALATVLSWPTPVFLPVFTLALTYAVFLLGYADLPRLRAYNRLGDYSYGIYIYAFPVQQIMVMHGATTPWSNMALAFPATLLLAVLSWHLVERPALKLRPDRARPAVVPGIPQPATQARGESNAASATGSR